MALMDHNAGIFKISSVNCLEARYLGISVYLQKAPVEVVFSDRPAKTLGRFKFGCEPAGVDHELFRNTAANYTGATEPIRFDKCNACTVLRGDSRGANTARASAHDNQIKHCALCWIQEASKRCR